MRVQEDSEEPYSTPSASAPASWKWHWTALAKDSTPTTTDDFAKYMLEDRPSGRGNRCAAVEAVLLKIGTG